MSCTVQNKADPCPVHSFLRTPLPDKPQGLLRPKLKREMGSESIGFRVLIRSTINHGNAFRAWKTIDWQIDEFLFSGRMSSCHFNRPALLTIQECQKQRYWLVISSVGFFLAYSLFKDQEATTDQMCRPWVYIRPALGTCYMRGKNSLTFLQPIW